MGSTDSTTNPIDVAELEPPRWLSDGMHVLAPWSRTDTHQLWARCKVHTAAGDAARVVNERRGIDRWLPLHSLRSVPAAPVPA
jgi:hypothetical protein